MPSGPGVIKTGDTPRMVPIRLPTSLGQKAKFFKRIVVLDSKLSALAWSVKPRSAPANGLVTAQLLINDVAGLVES
jgi:hypothetical protein